MSKDQAPYSIALRATGHEFDLQDLGATKSVFVGGIIGGNNPDTSHLFTTHSVTREDYDQDFREKLMEIDPPQRVRDFLQHHLQHSITNLGGASVFLDHFEYVILHWLEQYKSKSPNTAAARAWYDKTMDNIHKQHRRERDYFLSEAFRIAHEHSPSNPLQVNLNPRELGKHLGFDEDTTTRIMNDLVDEKLVESGLGMHMLLIQPKGRRYLEQLHGDDDPRLNPPTVVNHTYNASGGSILQVANASPNATQTASVGDEIQEARTFAQQLSTALPEIEKVAPADQLAEIKDELEFLKKKLDSTTPSKSVVKTIKDELIKRVVGLPFDAAKWFGPQFLQGL